MFSAGTLEIPEDSIDVIGARIVGQIIDEKEQFLLVLVVLSGLSSAPERSWGVLMLKGLITGSDTTLCWKATGTF